MKELQDFVNKHTNIYLVTDTGWRYEDITELEFDFKNGNVIHLGFLNYEGNSESVWTVK